MSRANDPVHPNMMEAGLTIREHFAAMAMQGLLADSTTVRLGSDVIPKTAVAYADLLISELAKGA
jgi:hypothetical protein